MAKDKAGKLPKRIGGIKLPKKARKQANAALAALNQPIVRELAAAALTAASAAATKATAAKPEPVTKTTGTPPRARSGGSQLAEVAAGVAIAALGKWLAKADTPAVGATTSKPIEPLPNAEHPKST